jgi:hypothetical protein
MMPGTILSSHSSGSRSAHNLLAKGDRRGQTGSVEVGRRQFADVRVGSMALKKAS